MTALPAAAGGTTFRNALMGGELGSLRIAGSHISSLNERPRPGDRIIDLEGDRLLPGLINAHDHLQLNSLPPLGLGGRYQHVKEWIADINARRRADPEFELQASVARDTRLAIGGIKNLLCGATTVAHHDPLYARLSDANYPVATVTRYGWSHSLYLETPTEVGRSYHATPVNWPWIIHAAEGLDEEAATEFERLEALGCLRPNTVLVHGIALDPTRRSRLHRANAALIWCPASNIRLFGKTAEVEELIALGRVALGTDSRLSGSRDLLDELRLAAQIVNRDEATLESLVTRDSSRILRLSDRGTLRVGARADILVLPATVRLSRATRSDVRLVVVGGHVRYGDRDYAEALAPASRWSEVRVDGRLKVLDRNIVRWLRDLNAVEEGLELPNRSWRAA